MVSGLPDYTRMISVDVSITTALAFMATKAEHVDKKSAYGTGALQAQILLDAPPTDEKTGLLMVVASTSQDGGTLTIESYQSGTFTEVMEDIHIDAGKPVVLVFPCWIPTQDNGDGAQQNIRITVDGAGCAANCSVFALYFEEEV